MSYYRLEPGESAAVSGTGSSGRQAKVNTLNEVALCHKRIAADGIYLHAVTAGKGPPVILLHGFPENWLSWRRQIPVLVAAGFSVLAPDLRGYNLSDRPADQSAYRLEHLVKDVAALVRSTGHPRSHIVGHDWGGVIAWAFATQYPQLVDKLIVLNAPHLKIYFNKVRYPGQMLRSWYVLFFLMPRLPEFILSAQNYGALRNMFKRLPASKNAFSAEDTEQYIHALASPGALTAALNYYRANINPAVIQGFADAMPIEAQTLVIWGELDPALGIELLDGLDKVAPHVRIRRIPDSSHWVQNEAPAEVNRLLVDFLQSPRCI
jgi:pimeloyl-ACP methyl ester carboxylesterase